MGHVAAPTAVRFEHRTDEDPVLGIGTATPRLSWIVPAADAGFVQEAYEVELTRAGGTPEVVRVTSGEQVLVPWPAAPLTSRESVRVRVRVSGAGLRSDWSDPATVEAGLLRTEDWTARFISPRELGKLGAPAPVLRSAFDLPGGVVRARLYATAHGLYEATLNGHRVGDQVLAPGWTSYGHRLRYQTYDVTGLVREGGNDLEVLLGNGWYRGRLGWDGRHAHYGDRLALLAQLEVTTRMGRSSAWAPTPPGWPARAGSWPTTSMTASGPTCVPGAATARTPSRSSTRTWPAWSRPTARRSGSPRPCPRPLSSPRRPAPPWSTSARTSSAGCGSGSGTRPRARRSWSATPRCWSTGSWGSGRSGPPRPPTPTCWPARPWRCWSRA